MSSQQTTETGSSDRMQNLLRRSILAIFIVALTLGLTLILSFNLVRGTQVSVTIGQPAPQEVVAPQSTTYVSDVLTDRARQQAATSVIDEYTPIDLSIARQQNNHALAVFNFIETVRADSIAPFETKLEYLAEIEGLSIDPRVAADLIMLSSAEFTAARNNVLSIIEDTMRSGVVEGRLAEAQLKAALGAAFDLTPAQERVVISLAPQFIVPNIFFDQEATADLQEEAMASVEPITQIVTKDERIIRVGDIIEEEDIEKLEQLGLLQQELDLERLLSAFLSAFLVVMIIALYWNEYFSDMRNAVKGLTILGVLILLFVIGAKLLLPSKSIYNYLFPAAALSIMVAAIFETRLSILVTVGVAFLSGYIAQESLEMAVYAAAGGILAVLTLHDTQRISALFRAGLVASVASMAVILIFRLPEDLPISELMTILAFGFLSGPISASLSLAGIFILGSLFRVTTSLQLQDLSRLDHPLLQELLRRAPGTYHHSIMVANLAEQAAEKVKAQSTLVRVGAFYHDVGKLNRPPFFSENQNGGNPHDKLDPYSSARIIKSHVSDGLDLARRYRLPNRIRDFIGEHHGDRVIKVFYKKALDLADEGEIVDVSRFKYDGPRPRSRETGIVQLADSIEATTRALTPSTEEEIAKLVTSIVDDHIKEGQLDDSGLTLGDINILKESFIKTTMGRFHVRVKYPGNEELTGPRPEEIPALPAGQSVEAPVVEEQEKLEEVDEPV